MYFRHEERIGPKAKELEAMCRIVCDSVPVLGRGSEVGKGQLQVPRLAALARDDKSRESGLDRDGKTSDTLFSHPSAERLRMDGAPTVLVYLPERTGPVSVHRNVSSSVWSWICCSTPTPAEWPPSVL